MNLKVIIITVVSFCIVAMVVVLVINFYWLNSAQKKIVENGHDYEPYSATSADGKYLLKTNRLYEKTGAYVTFVIEIVDSQKVVFQCSDRYRAYDLKSITWDSLNVIVVSGDVGTITYRFTGDSWTK